MLDPKFLKILSEARQVKFPEGAIADYKEWLAKCKEIGKTLDGKFEIKELASNEKAARVGTTIIGYWRNKVTKKETVQYGIIRDQFSKRGAPKKSEKEDDGENETRELKITLFAEVQDDETKKFEPYDPKKHRTEIKCSNKNTDIIDAAIKKGKEDFRKKLQKEYGYDYSIDVFAAGYDGKAEKYMKKDDVPGFDD